MITAIRSMAPRHGTLPEQPDGALQHRAPDERRTPECAGSAGKRSGGLHHLHQPHGRDPHRDSVKFRRKATELSIPCITALDTARILVNALRSDHDISGMELVDIATLHRDAANGK